MRGRRAYQRLWWRLLGWSFPVLDPSENPHPGEELPEIPELEDYPIDLELIPVIRGLWARGMPTVDSCQGDRRLEALSGQQGLYSTSIGFEHMEDAHRLRAILEEIIDLPDRPELRSQLSLELIQGYSHLSFPPALIAPLSERLSTNDSPETG